MGTARRKRLHDLRRFGRYLWFFKLTRTGKALALGGCVAGAIGSASIQVPVYQLFFVLLLLGVVAFFANLVHRPKLVVNGALPDRISMGQQAHGTFTLTNRSRLPAYDVGLAFFGMPPRIWELDFGKVVRVLQPGDSIPLSITVEPGRRGIYPLPPIRAYSSFPFGFLRSGSHGQHVSALLVLPAFEPLEAIDVPVSRRYQPGGIALTSNVGESPEYIGNRDYRPGDSFRRIDFKAWARLAAPVVREFHEEYYCRVALVLDTYLSVPRRPSFRSRLSKVIKDRPEQVYDETPLEAAISMSAAIADALGRSEYIIDIFAAGPELHHFRAGRHIAHTENVLDILACVEPCQTNPFHVLTPAIAEELGNISTLICVMLDWDVHRRALIQTAIEAGCSVKIILIVEDESTVPADVEEWSDSCVVLTTESVRQGGIDVL